MCVCDTEAGRCEGRNKGALGNSGDRLSHSVAARYVCGELDSNVNMGLDSDSRCHVTKTRHQDADETGSMSCDDDEAVRRRCRDDGSAVPCVQTVDVNLQALIEGVIGKNYRKSAGKRRAVSIDGAHTTFTCYLSFEEKLLQRKRRRLQQERVSKQQQKQVSQQQRQQCLQQEQVSQKKRQQQQLFQQQQPLYAGVVNGLASVTRSNEVTTCRVRQMPLEQVPTSCPPPLAGSQPSTRLPPPPPLLFSPHAQLPPLPPLLSLDDASLMYDESCKDVPSWHRTELSGARGMPLPMTLACGRSRSCDEVSSLRYSVI